MGQSSGADMNVRGPLREATIDCTLIDDVRILNLLSTVTIMEEGIQRLISDAILSLLLL